MGILLTMLLASAEVAGESTTADHRGDIETTTTPPPQTCVRILGIRICIAR